MRAPAGHGPPRGPDAHERPHRRARLRPRHDRAAAVDLDGLHRRRPGRDDRRARVGGRAVRATPGGRRSCSAAPGSRRTGCCARARSGATATPTRCAARSATPTTPTGSPSIRRPAKELRLFGLAGWTIDRFVARRTRLHELQYEATRLREKPLLWSLLLVARRQRRRVLVAGDAGARRPHLDLGELVVFAQAAVGTSMIAFGGLNWALDGAAAPVAAVLRLEPAMAPAGALPSGHARRPPACPRARSASATSRSPIRAARRSSSTSTSRSPPARRWRSSARTAPARRRSPSCCAGSTTRRPARSRSTASTCASSTSTSWRARVDRRVPGLHPLRAAAARQRRAGRRARRRRARGARRRPAPRSSPSLDTVLARGYDGGTDLSGGQWQRVALARALCAVRLGAGVVLLDEPTAQLDVRGEAEIFERILAATRHCTTILISHRFSTVRHADRICVLEHGRVVELGTHDELMALRRPLPHDVRPAGAALRRGRGRGGDGAMTSSPERGPTARRARATTCRRRCRRCGGCASSATATSRG